MMNRKKIPQNEINSDFKFSNIYEGDAAFENGDAYGAADLGRGSGSRKAVMSERKRKKLRRRVIRRRIVFSFLAFLLLALLLFLLTLFFNVKTISVIGDLGPYSESQIIAGTGIQEGDRFFYIDTEKAEENAETSLPYICNVNVRKKLFSTVIIEVEKSEEVFCFDTENGYAVTNENYKVLEVIQQNSKSTATEILGLPCEAPSVGSKLSFTDADKLDIFNTLLSDFKGESIRNITKIDVSDKLDIRVVCNDGELEVIFGGYASLDYKLRFAEGVIEKLYSGHENVSGTLNLSILKKAYYSPRTGEDNEVIDEDIIQ